MEQLVKYLVRPHDCHIWELDESNNRYRSWSTRMWYKIDKRHK